MKESTGETRRVIKHMVKKGKHEGKHEGKHGRNPPCEKNKELENTGR